MAKKQQQQQRQRPQKQKPTASPHDHDPSPNLTDTRDSQAPPRAHALRDQQRLLDLFAHALRHVLAADGFARLLRELKQALFDRAFGAAFSREDLLPVYAARWSPPRALCYAAVLATIREHLHGLVCPCPVAADDCGSSSECLRMLSIGGCAAEHVAFAAHLAGAGVSGALTLVDSGPWAPIVALLQDAITAPPPLSKYASAAARAANAPLLEAPRLRTDFLQMDVLSASSDRLRELATAGGSNAGPLLVTLMFTLNELYATQGIGRTTELLNTLGDVVPGGSLLLVVDSPGSYSEAAVGKERKKYPMQWLLDLALLQEGRGARRESRWRKLEAHDSVWFRLPEDLTYPIQLENMRYQMHLYRREDIPRIEA